MASKILVDELAPYSHATDVTLATGKKIAGAETQYKVTGGLADQVLTSDGSSNLVWSGMAGFHTIKFDETPGGSEAYTVPTGAKQLLVFLTGGGAAGGGAAAAGEGSGGGSASTTIALITVSGGEATTIVIGAGSVAVAAANAANGGDSTFTYVSGGTSFSTVTAKGGIGGVYYTSAQSLPVAGTVGATNTGIAFYGGMGTPPIHGSTLGASSFYGSGGAGGVNGKQVAFVGLAAGSGGGGAISTSGYRTSGAGADGCIIIYVFK